MCFDLMYPHCIPSNFPLMYHPTFPSQLHMLSIFKFPLSTFTLSCMLVGMGLSTRRWAVSQILHPIT